MHTIFGDKVIVKIKYGAQIYNITWDIKKKLSYKKLFHFLGKSFKIKKDDIKYLELSDEYGRVYEKTTLEYYIRLCPKLDKLFHLKTNYRKRMSPVKVTNIISPEIFNDNERVNLYESSKYKRKRCEDGTPVFRQNCFIGQLPKYETGTPVFRQNCFIGQLPKYETGTPVFRQNCFIGQLPKYATGTPVLRQNSVIGEISNCDNSTRSANIDSYDNPVLKRQRISCKRQRYVRI